MAEYNGSGTLLRKYIYGPGLDEPIIMIVPGETSETVYYYHADSQGTIIGLTNDSGAWVEKYAYTLYGKPAAASTIGNPYMYTGRRLDAETGLYYYRARYYDPHLRRFIETDPIGYAGGMNLYAYVGNSPTNFIDPYGLFRNHYKDINIDRSGGKIYYKGNLYAWRLSDGNWYEATLDPNTKMLYKDSYDIESVIVHDLVKSLERGDNIDFGLSCVSLGAATGSAIATGGTAWIFWGIGAAADLTSFSRSGDPTQLGPSGISIPIGGPVTKAVGGALGVGAAAINTVREIDE